MGYDFNQQLSDYVESFDIEEFNNDQDNFVLYLDITRRLAWDIPSALGCSHIDREIPMHRPQPQIDHDNPIFINWDELDQHYKEVHGLDLTDNRINWSFDT